MRLLVMQALIKLECKDCLNALLRELISFYIILMQICELEIFAQFLIQSSQPCQI